MLSYLLELFYESFDIVNFFLLLYHVINYYHIFKVNIWIHRNFNIFVGFVISCIEFFLVEKGFVRSLITFFEFGFTYVFDKYIP